MNRSPGWETVLSSEARVCRTTCGVFCQFSNRDCRMGWGMGPNGGRLLLVSSVLILVNTVI